MSQHVTLNVEGMSCQHCVSAIKSSLTQLNGVLDVIVDLEAKRVAVEYDAERLDLNTIKGTIEDTGYTIR